MPSDLTSQYSAILNKSILDSFKLLFSSIILNYWYFWLLLLFFQVSPSIYRFIRFNKAGLAQISKMSGTDFEMFLEQLFTKLGYSVERVGKVGDYGADLVIEKDGIRTVVQAKQRSGGYIGVDAIQEIVASKPHYNAAAAMVITNSYFSNAAKQLARENQVVLKDKSELADLILKPLGR